MEPDTREIHIDLKFGQAALLLARLEDLRSELGTVGEDLIALLRDAGVTPPPASWPYMLKSSRDV